MLVAESADYTLGSERGRLNSVGFEAHWQFSIATMVGMPASMWKQGIPQNYCSFPDYRVYFPWRRWMLWIMDSVTLYPTETPVFFRLHLQISRNSPTCTLQSYPPCPADSEGGPDKHIWCWCHSGSACCQQDADPPAAVSTLIYHQVPAAETIHRSWASCQLRCLVRCNSHLLTQLSFRDAQTKGRNWQ